MRHDFLKIRNIYRGFCFSFFFLIMSIAVHYLILRSFNAAFFLILQYLKMHFLMLPYLIMHYLMLHFLILHYGNVSLFGAALPRLNFTFYVACFSLYPKQLVERYIYISEISSSTTDMKLKFTLLMLLDK